MNGANERDRSVERLLQQSLKTPPPAEATGTCLDAETVATWVDGGLSGAALEAAQLHVVECARCQALVGAVARTSDPASGAASADPAASGRPWWMMWALPMAAAAAVALYVAVPQSPTTPPPDVAEDRRQAPSTPPQAQAPAPAASLQPQSSAARAQGPAATPAQDSAVPSPLPRASSFPPAQTSAVPPPQAPPPEAAPLTIGGVAKAAPSSALGRLEAGASRAAPVDAGNRQRAEQALPAQRDAKSLGATREADRATLLEPASQRADRTPPEIVSPDPLVRWRLAGNAVERSVDGGTRWERAPVGNTTTLIAGAAPSPSVCWLVGSGGAVFLSADGRTWRRVAFPEITDLSSVRATDARTATVSTADGRTFSTRDGGATWAR